MSAVSGSYRDALVGLRRARRAHRAAEVDVFDGFYQAYLSAVALGAGILFGGDLVGDARLHGAAAVRAVDRGPALVGIGLAVVVAMGLRSGARGGPLVLPAADVRYVLMAPVPRDDALRGPAVRHVRFLAFAGMIAGAVGGVLASHRLPGGLAAWVAAGAAGGILASMMGTGAALVMSGLRLGRVAASALSVLVLGWAAVDVIARTRTSPTSLIGVLVFWPARVRLVGLAGLAPPLVAAGAGVWLVGGSSVEAAERRASLASQIRFALTLQDLRTVVLLRRQLNQEMPRSRPWVRLPPLRKGKTLIWRRDLRGIARWPAMRAARVLVLGALAGACLVGAWAGTTPLIVPAALALFLAGLEALEPLAQEVDHPDLPGSVPAELGQLRLAHVPASFALVFVVVLVGWGTAALIGPGSVVVPVGAAMLLPAALLATVGAAASIMMGPPLAAGSLMLPAEAAGAAMIVRVLWAPLLVLLGLTPMLLARSAMQRGMLPGPAAVSGAVFPVMVASLALGWVRFREQIHVWMKPPPPAAAE